MRAWHGRGSGGAPSARTHDLQERRVHVPQQRQRLRRQDARVRVGGAGPHQDALRHLSGAGPAAVAPRARGMSAAARLGAPHAPRATQAAPKWCAHSTLKPIAPPKRSCAPTGCPGPAVRSDGPPALVPSVLDPHLHHAAGVAVSIVDLGNRLTLPSGMAGSGGETAPREGEKPLASRRHAASAYQGLQAVEGRRLTARPRSWGQITAGRALGGIETALCRRAVPCRGVPQSAHRCPSTGGATHGVIQRRSLCLRALRGLRAWRPAAAREGSTRGPESRRSQRSALLRTACPASSCPSFCGRGMGHSSLWVGLPVQCRLRMARMVPRSKAPAGLDARHVNTVFWSQRRMPPHV